LDKLKSALILAYDKFSAVGPDLIIAIIFLVIGILIAFFTKKIAILAIKQIHPDKHNSASGWISIKQFNFLVNVISKTTFWATIIVFIALTAEVLGINLFEDWFKAFGNYVPNIIAAILILVSGEVFSNYLKDFLNRSLNSAGVESAKNIAVAGYVISLSVVLLVSINQVGIDLGFLTSIILLLVACFLLCGAISFGLGSAPIVTNILSTYYLRRTLKIGQNIQCIEISGRIVEINATSIQLQTPDGLEIIPTKILNSSGYRIKNVGS